jgi:uncharacterized membrane protein YqjE
MATGSPPSDLKAAAQTAASSALGLLRIRLELASIEWAEERERLLTRLGLLFAALLLVIFGVLGLGVLAALYFWDTEREAAVLVPTALCILTGLLLYYVSRRMGRGALPFAATLAEFDKDRAALTPAMRPAPAEAAPTAAPTAQGTTP